MVFLQKKLDPQNNSCEGEIETLPALAFWDPGAEVPVFDSAAIARAAERFREAAYLVTRRSDGILGVGYGGKISSDATPIGLSLLGILPPLYPEWLGDRNFCEIHGLRFPYLAGAMATGIGSVAVVVAMARAGMMGFFGSAGLGTERTAAAIAELQSILDPEGLPYGVNFIHSPNEPGMEEAMVDLFLETGIRRVEASAFMKLTPALVRFSAKGLTKNAEGIIERSRHVFAKLSRPELAEQMMNPPPEAMIRDLVASGKLSQQEGELARRLPVAEDIVVEADSGGHTDNRPLTALFSTILNRARELQEKNRYPRPIRVGAAGGLGTPQAVAAAFSLGTSFVLTGTVNQGCVEAGTSARAKAMLAQAGIADVTMAPAADMFELGVKVQVLKKGTFWPVRGQKLYELYKTYPAFSAIPVEERTRVEKEILRDSFENIWSGTREFFLRRDPSQVERAERDPKHQMALVFRWYLGMGSRWAIQGVEERAVDYQIWCGPAQGAFNDWVRGTYLEAPENRTVAQVALNLLEGAATLTRMQQFRNFGLEIRDQHFDYRPKKIRLE